MVVPFTGGISFYTLSLRGENFKVSRGYRVSEMVIKPPKRLAKFLVDSVSRLLPLVKKSQSRTPGISRFTSETKSQPNSIIHKYFAAWNRRDMEMALSCFVDDCVYQTVDPVFADNFQGKQLFVNI